MRPGLGGGGETRRTTFPALKREKSASATLWPHSGRGARAASSGGRPAKERGVLRPSASGGGAGPGDGTGPGPPPGGLLFRPFRLPRWRPRASSLASLSLSLALLQGRFPGLLGGRGTPAAPPIHPLEGRLGGPTAAPQEDGLPGLPGGKGGGRPRARARVGALEGSAPGKPGLASLLRSHPPPPPPPRILPCLSFQAGAGWKNMELERLSLEGAPEPLVGEERRRREEEGRAGGPCPGCSCENLHQTVSKWLLPERARATYLERATCLPPPLFILAVSAAELSVFIYYAVWKPQTQWITLDTGIWESPFIYRPDKRREAWRFLSYMLVHAGIEHIIGNLVLQLVLGIPLELVHKGHRVGLVYLAGVVGGSLASSICDPLQGLVGASGGVYALIGGYFMNILVNFQEMIPLFGAIRLLLIFFIVGTDVGFALYRRFLSPVAGVQST
ncbi:rhomboid-related protein 2 isoform X3 [Pogona vitticeps]